MSALAESSKWEEATRLIRGPFLDGFGVPDASDFEDWLAAKTVTSTSQPLEEAA